jgi:gamma-tubulin complex component 2
MFALFTASFTKSANQAIAAAETEEGDRGMAKRWDFLGKFETNFNHWLVNGYFTSCLLVTNYRSSGSR